MTLIVKPSLDAVIDPEDEAQRHDEILEDYVSSGYTLPASAADLNLIIAAGVAYVKGKRVEHTTSRRLAMTASATNHIYITNSKQGTDLDAKDHAFIVNTTGTAPANAIKIGTAVTSATAITSTTDARPTSPFYNTLPAEDNRYDLGSSAKRWRDLQIARNIELASGSVLRWAGAEGFKRYSAGRLGTVADKLAVLAELSVHESGIEIANDSMIDVIFSSPDFRIQHHRTGTAAIRDLVLGHLDASSVFTEMLRLVGGGNIKASKTLESIVGTDALLASALASAATSGLGLRVSGDSIYRFVVLADGTIEWGSGAAARDVNLFRGAANQLKTNDDIRIEDARITALQFNDLRAGGKLVGIRLDTPELKITDQTAGVDRVIIDVGTGDITKVNTVKLTNVSIPSAVAANEGVMYYNDPATGTSSCGMIMENSAGGFEDVKLGVSS